MKNDATHHASSARDSEPMRVTLDQHPRLRDVVAGIKAKAYLARQGVK